MCYHAGPNRNTVSIKTVEIVFSAAILVFAFICTVYSTETDVIWDLEAVDADGEGTHPKVDAWPWPENLCVVQGISLASTGELDNPDGGGFEWYSLWVQAEEEKGGIQVWAGPMTKELCWSTYPEVHAGDRVRITGWAGNFNGKVFINDRHSAQVMWSIQVLSPGNMPEADVLPSVSACNYFDQARVGGGERWQTRWTKLKGVEMVSGTWAAGEELEISDGTGMVLMKLATPGDFDDFTPPIGKFDVVGIFDQEDEVSPYHDFYRIWVKQFIDLRPQLTIERDPIAESIMLEWESKTGVTYRLMESDDMENWSQVGADIPGNDMIQTVTLYPSAAERYYRLELFTE